VTEDDYLSEIARLVRERGDVGADAVLLADAAVTAHPSSVRLWCRRGDLIQLGPEETPHALEDARASYERALQLDPDSADALESLGHYFDAVEPDESLAESYLAKSIERGASRAAFVSLAALYLETGRRHEALSLLSSERCPYADDPEVAVVRDEIAGLER
jgi:tetratricopeptide (TPR) repeat protein